MINDTPWTLFREKKKIISNETPPSISTQPQASLTPQEQLYSDYINLNYTFYPTVYTSCQHQMPSNRQELSSQSNSSKELSNPTQQQQQLQQQQLRNEILKEIYSSWKYNSQIQSFIPNSQPRLSQESNGELLDRGSESLENQKAIPIALPPSSEPPSPQAPTKSRIGIWPFRRTGKVCSACLTFMMPCVVTE